MKTSALNGKNISKLDFNWTIRYRPIINPSFNHMEASISSLLSDIPYHHLHYFWEKDRRSRLYHSHILVLNEYGEEIAEKIYKNIKGVGKIKSSQRETIVKVNKTFFNPKTDEKIEKFVDTKTIIRFQEFVGSKGTIHIEPVINNINSSYYCSKFTDRGIISGYLRGIS